MSLSQPSSPEKSLTVIDAELPQINGHLTLLGNARVLGHMPAQRRLIAPARAVKTGIPTVGDEVKVSAGGS